MRQRRDFARHADGAIVIGGERVQAPRVSTNSTFDVRFVENLGARPRKSPRPPAFQKLIFEVQEFVVFISQHTRLKRYVLY